MGRKVVTILLAPATGLLDRLRLGPKLVVIARWLTVRAAGGDRDAAAALPGAHAAVARSAGAFDATDRRLRAQLGTGPMWARLSASIKATVGARATDPRAALAAYDRLTSA